MSQAPRQLLLTGATGFVGGAVRSALVERGWQVRCMSRDAAKARRLAPEHTWVQGDVRDPVACAQALQGCQAALYLAHGIGEGADYHALEVEAAESFSNAAAEAGLERIVYLGGVAPSGEGSEHLRSRREVGEVLRRGRVKTVELRASMIVGHGSLSWLIVRDLAARLPVMVLPRWLKSRTEPVAIADVVIALVRALELPISASACFDVPGPEVMSGREILEQTSRVMGLRHPRMLEVSFLTPRLSSFWVRFVTRAKWSVAREVVIGLTEDLLAADDHFWRLIDHPQRASFVEAAQLALEEEHRHSPVGGIWGGIERARGGRALGTTGASSAPSAAPSSRAFLALACVAAWIIAAASAVRFGIWLAMGGVAIALGVGVLLLDRPTTRAQLRPSPGPILLGATVGALMAAATYLLYPLFDRMLPLIARDTARLYSEFRGPSLLVASLALAPVILGEELVWRSVVQSALVRRLGPALGVTLAACVYALAHAPLGSPVLMFAALACGLCWGTLRAATNSLVPSVVAHLVWDLVVLFVRPISSLS